MHLKTRLARFIIQKCVLCNLHNRFFAASTLSVYRVRLCAPATAKHNHQLI